ncbi:MAG: hypothetical protein WCD07_02970 [Burkholderiales bacterium]
MIGTAAHAESVTPYSNPSKAPKATKDLLEINGDNLQTFLKNSAPVRPLKIEPTPSPVAKLHNGPAIFLTIGVPASLAEAVRTVNTQTQQPATVETKKMNFSGDNEPINAKPVSIAAFKNPLLQNAASMSDAMPPAVWLLGFGLLGMAGISRRRKSLP